MISPLNAEIYVKLSPLTDSDHRYVVRCRNNPIQRFRVSFNTQLNTVASYVLSRMIGQNSQRSSNNNSYLNTSSNNYCSKYNSNFKANSKQYTHNSIKVSLSVQRLGSFVSIPLSITISELMIMTSMDEEALLFYSFIQPQQNISSEDSIENFSDQQPENSFNQFSTVYSVSPQQRFQSSFSSPPMRVQSISTSPTPAPPQTPPKFYSPPSFSNNSRKQYYTQNQYSGTNSTPTFRNQQITNCSEVPTSPSCSLFHTGISMYTDSFGTMPPSFTYDQSNSSFSNSEFYGTEVTSESIKLKQSLEAMIHRSNQF